MSEMTLIVPNDWVTQDKLVEITGLRPGTIEAARKKSWMVGREYLHVAPDGNPKENSECMYNRKAVDQWVESMSRNSRVRANEDPFMLSGLLDVRRE